MPSSLVQTPCRSISVETNYFASDSGRHWMFFELQSLGENKHPAKWKINCFLVAGTATPVKAQRYIGVICQKQSLIIPDTLVNADLKVILIQFQVYHAYWILFYLYIMHVFQNLKKETFWISGSNIQSSTQWPCWQNIGNLSKYQLAGSLGV